MAPAGVGADANTAPFDLGLAKGGDQGAGSYVEGFDANGAGGAGGLAPKGNVAGFPLSRE